MQRQKFASLIRFSCALWLSLLVVMLGWLPKPEAAVQTVSFGAKSNFGTGSSPVSAMASTATQFSQQGPKLVGTGAVSAEQGLSVSLSGDGNTAIVGGPNDNGGNGAAWVWTRSGGVWTQQGTKLVGSGAVGDALQGYSVSLSGDGNTALVGGRGFANTGDGGGAWVWTRSGGVWTQQGTKLIGSGSVGRALQGNSVSLSADGNTAIVGGPYDNGNIGAAWIWTRSGGVWTQQGTKLVGSGAVGEFVSQGFSVSLSADGNTAIVGGPDDNGNIGAVWVWTRSGGVWTQQGTKLIGSGAVGNASQGFSVSLSGDGNTALVGGTSDGFNGIAGAAWVWTRSGGVWTQQGSKLVGSGTVGEATQGHSVSLSGDGNMAFVGGYQDNGQVGAAWIWTRSGGVWTQQGTKLVGSGAVGNAFQGYSVSLSGDGNTALVGGPGDNRLGDFIFVGAAWVFATIVSPGVCQVSDLTPITDSSARMFEDAAPNTPVFSLFFPSVELTLDNAIGAFSSDVQATLGFTPSRSSGFRPLAYQAHFYELRTKLKDIREAIRRDPTQATACDELKRKIDKEIDITHGIARGTDGLPKVNPPAASAHTSVPATAIDLSGIRNLPPSQQITIDRLARQRSLARPYPQDPVHFKLVGTPSSQTVRARVESPVNILIIDPIGRKVGFDPVTASVINQVGPSAFYTGPNTEPQDIEIGGAIPGLYAVIGTGTGTGFYTLTLERVDEDGELLETKVRSGTISSGEVVSLNINISSLAFDVCIQDDSAKSTLQINSTTGEYQFTSCDSGGFTISGTGIVTTRGSTITLQHFAEDRRLVAKIDKTVQKGNASVQFFPQGRIFAIIDRNFTNNTCACP